MIKPWITKPYFLGFQRYPKLGTNPKSQTNSITEYFRIMIIKFCTIMLQNRCPRPKKDSLRRTWAPLEKLLSALFTIFDISNGTQHCGTIYIVVPLTTSNGVVAGDPTWQKISKKKTSPGSRFLVPETNLILKNKGFAIIVSRCCCCCVAGCYCA